MENAIPSIRLLPPLSDLPTAADVESEASSQDDVLTLPCFPLEVAENVRIVPHSKGIVLLVSEARYVALMRSVWETSKRAKAGQSGHRCLVATQIIRRRDEDCPATAADDSSDMLRRAAIDDSSDMLRRGAIVKLKGLKRAPELNGSVGKLLHFHPRTERWDVDVEDIGVRALRTENLMRLSDDTAHKSFGAWLTSADVGGDWQLAQVGVMLHLEKFEEITASKTSAGNRQPAYKCTFSAVGRAHISHICNPAAFADRSTFMLARVKNLADKDEGIGLMAQEARVVTLLKDLLMQHQKLTQGVSVVPKKKVLESLSAGPGAKFWEVVALWELFLQAHVRTLKLKNIVDQSLQKIAALSPDRLKDLQDKLTTMLTQSEEGQPSAAINVKELPSELLGELRSLRAQAKLTIFDRTKMTPNQMYSGARSCEKVVQST